MVYIEKKKYLSKIIPSYSHIGRDKSEYKMVTCPNCYERFWVHNSLSKNIKEDYNLFVNGIECPYCDF